jgi:predicted alpha/beta superfamily hydrolase
VTKILTNCDLRIKNYELPMKKIPFLFFFLLIPVLFFGQLTLKVTGLPSNTPTSFSLYVAGTFNNWNAGDANYILTRRADGVYAITFTPAIGQVQYKYTRGTWATNEGDANGAFQANHTFNYTGQRDSISINILSWQDVGASTHTTAPNVQILNTAFPMPQLNRTRRIWLYLPPDYTTNTTKRYPVIYMHDGQNLFDIATSFSGEWQIDESLNNLFSQGDGGAIVVGIDNGGASRLNEYSPWINTQYGGGEGRKYVNFITDSLKPYIDRSFRTKTDRLNTAIAGSSMGGLISMFAAIERQDVFSKAGILSPSFWFNDSCFAHVTQRRHQQPMKIYFVAGQTESTGMIPDIQRMMTTLTNVGFSSNEMKLVSKADGQHSEWFWSREFPDAYKWLFATTSETEEVNLIKANIFPNPTDSTIQIDWDSQTTEKIIVNIFDTTGRLFKSNIHISKSTPINVSDLPSGTYVLSGLGEESKEIVFSKKIVINHY